MARSRSHVGTVGAVGMAVVVRLNQMCKSRGMSQLNVRDALKDVGYDVSLMTVHRILRGERTVTVDELACFALVFGVRPGSLLETPVSSTEVWKAMS